MKQNEWKQLLRELVTIPAPLCGEENRAKYCVSWLAEHGITEVIRDEAGNVIVPYKLREGRNNLAFTAHLDTVFSADTTLAVKENNDIWSCPGIGDDTANLVVMMGLMEEIWKKQPESECGVFFVLDTGEEGLGNLRGCRQFMKTYGDRVKSLVSFDLYQEEMYDSCIGSTRYELSVRTQGGHSYHKFGSPNAITVLSGLITDLYRYRPEAEEEKSGKTTYNVGTIQGGTSVNTIAQDASCLFEYRSQNAEAMRQAHGYLMEVIENHKREGVEIDCRVIGERPCIGDVDRKAQDALAAICCESIRKVTGSAPATGAASTDCNIPLSAGIPSVCVGLIRGGGAHTKEEWVDVSSLNEGMQIAAEIFQFLISGKEKEQ